MNYHSQGLAKGPYRSKYGLVLGVLRGMSNHFGISVLVLRLITVFLAVFFTFCPVALAYIVLALVMPTDPRYGT